MDNLRLSIEATALRTLSKKFPDRAIFLDKNVRYFPENDIAEEDYIQYWRLSMTSKDGESIYFKKFNKVEELVEEINNLTGTMNKLLSVRG